MTEAQKEAFRSRLAIALEEWVAAGGDVRVVADIIVELADAVSQEAA